MPIFRSPMLSPRTQKCEAAHTASRMSIPIGPRADWPLAGSGTIQRERTPMGLFDGKRGVIFGIANKNSIASGIAERLDAERAELAIGYTERLERGVRKV